MFSLKGLRILFADDEKFLMRPTIDALESMDAIVDIVADGTSILNYLHENESLPAVLILDIMMPGGKEIRTRDEGRSTGVVVYKQIRKEERTKNLPIIVTSVVTDKNLLSKFESDPKVVTIAKPFRFTELYGAIEKVI